MTKALMEAASLYNDPRFLSKSEIRIRENKKRRLRIVRRQKIALFLGIAFILFIILFSSYSLMSVAQDDNFVPKCKYYKVLTVHAGDNISQLAQEYFDEEEYEDFGSYVSEICKINQLTDSNFIKAGENIVVPYYDEYK
ncbi:MAG: LysM peptidoglycan-binding domain-containing protein [Butyrivibrio sp.]|uniref:LysM peptidoglycan-binding domain-containing protein n=1 Tax=Butyrivibrio sp. TaxID=28121 RepID=UPI0025BAC703|nr:LysM peptidoglycan-binding domain-containing protein [Butyrivibrio sp.]MBQ6588845.1 LysM peptidoglycan-binding domain-containing protein [Butyrivibrio sp.]